MPALSKASLKALWKNFFQPTSADFADLISSWTDYYAGLEVLGAAVSGGSTGLANFTSPTTVSFLAVGATGTDLVATGTAASARTVLELGALATRSTVSAANIEAASVSAAAIVDNSITLAKITRTGASGQSLLSGGAGTDASYGWTGVVQRVVTATSSIVSGAPTTPLDNSIPQVTEGLEYLAVTITPKDASNILVVSATVFFSVTNAATITAHLHRASSADAISAVSSYTSLNANNTVSLTHSFVANTVAAVPIQLRMGPNTASALRLNADNSGVQLYGGVAGSMISVTEIAP